MVGSTNNKDMFTSIPMFQSTTFMSAEGNQMDCPETILSYSNRSTTLSPQSDPQQQSTELVDEKVQLNQGTGQLVGRSISGEHESSNNTGTLTEINTDPDVENQKDATTEEQITNMDSEHRGSPSSEQLSVSSSPASSLNAVESIRSHYDQGYDLHLHLDLHRGRHTSRSLSNHPSDPKHGPNVVSRSQNLPMAASASPSPPSTTPASPTLSLNRRSYPDEILLVDTRSTTWHPLSPPSGTLHKLSPVPQTQQQYHRHFSYPRPVSATHRSASFSSDTSSHTSPSYPPPPPPPPHPLLSPAPLSPSLLPPISRSHHRLSPSSPLLKEATNTEMDYSPSSDKTLYRDKGEHRRFTSHPELADLEPNDERQTQNTIDTYAATEHSMDRGEHSQLYTNPHPRGLHNPAVRPFEDRPPRLPTTWSFSTAGSHNLPSLAPKPHTMTTGRTTETSTPVDDDKQRLPLLNKDSNASKGIKTVDEGATSSSRIGAAEAEGAAHPFKVISARGTPKGPLPIDVQISLLTSVLKHDPFNCPIRRTTQVWERISREQGIRARTCARRYDNIIQASIAGRDRPSGSEEQIATKKRLLEQLFVMMNQPQAIVRMQKKRRYRSEEADRRLLLETIRLNPFAQKVGQVAKAWEDVRDALGMKVHARQCIRRVNRMIKPFQLRERMYKGNIPEELREVNDDLVKQVIQLMYLGGHSGSLEEDDGQSNDEDSVSGISDPDDHDDGFTGSEARKRELPQDDDELEDDEDDKMVGLNDVGQNSSRSQKQEFYIPSMRITGTSEAATTTDRSVSSEYHQSHNPGYDSVGTRKRQKEAGVNDGTRPHESEFRPQRIWGSSPYTNEALARSTSGLYVSRDPQQSSRARAGKSDDAMLYGGEFDHRSVLAQRPSFMDVAHHPVAALSPRSAHAPPPSGPNSSASSSTLSVDPLLHQTVLREFHVVKDYLGRLEGQRQRDKNNQKAMFNIIEDLQHQVQEQQRHIEDLQSQVQNGYPPRSYHDSSATTSSPHSQRSNHYYDSSPTRYRYYSQYHSQSGREYSRSPSP